MIDSVLMCVYVCVHVCVIQNIIWLLKMVFKRDAHIEEKQHHKSFHVLHKIKKSVYLPRKL